MCRGVPLHGRLIGVVGPHVRSGSASFIFACGDFDANSAFDDAMDASALRTHGHVTEAQQTLCAV